MKSGREGKRQKKKVAEKYKREKEGRKEGIS